MVTVLCKHSDELDHVNILWQIIEDRRGNGLKQTPKINQNTIYTSIHNDPYLTHSPSLFIYLLINLFSITHLLSRTLIPSHTKEARLLNNYLENQQQKPLHHLITRPAQYVHTHLDTPSVHTLHHVHTNIPYYEPQIMDV